MNHNSGYATSQIFIGGRNPMVGEENIATGYIISHELTWTEQVVNRNMMQTDGACGMSGTRKKKHQQQNRRHAKKADHNKSTTLRTLMNGIKTNAECGYDVESTARKKQKSRDREPLKGAFLSYSLSRQPRAQPEELVQPFPFRFSMKKSM